MRGPSVGFGGGSALNGAPPLIVKYSLMCSRSPDIAYQVISWHGTDNRRSAERVSASKTAAALNGTSDAVRQIGQSDWNLKVDFAHLAVAASSAAHCGRLFSCSLIHQGHSTKPLTT